MRRFEVLRAWDLSGRDSVPRFNFEEEDGFFAVLEEDREIESGFEFGFEAMPSGVVLDGWMARSKVVFAFGEFASARKSSDYRV